MEEQTANLLSEIYKDASISSRCIDTLLPKISDYSLRQELKGQRLEYLKFAKEAESMLSLAGEKPIGPCIVLELFSDASTAVGALLYRTPEKIAQKMINANQKSMARLSDSLSEQPESEQFSKTLCRDLLRFRRGSMMRLQNYL